MANKLSWNPPKWKFYSFDGTNFKVKLETGKVFEGSTDGYFIRLKNHENSCFEIFGVLLGKSENSSQLSELSQVLDLKLNMGYWPEYHDIGEFLKRYYERIGNSNKSKIYIETEFDITPKFTI